MSQLEARREWSEDAEVESAPPACSDPGEAAAQTPSTPIVLRTPWQRRLINAIGKRFPRNTVRDCVATTMHFPASPQAVWESIRFYEEVPGIAPWLLRFALPAPRRTQGAKQSVGAVILCEYEHASIIKQIRAVRPAEELRFDAIQQSFGIEDALNLGEGSYVLRPTADGGTDVTLSTWYRGHLRPRWLAKACEAWFAHMLHRHILRGMQQVCAEISKPG